MKSEFADQKKRFAYEVLLVNIEPNKMPDVVEGLATKL